MTPVMLDCNQKYQYEFILNILAVHVNDAELNTDVHLFIVSIQLHISHLCLLRGSGSRDTPVTEHAHRVSKSCFLNTIL